MKEPWRGAALLLVNDFLAMSQAEAMKNFQSGNCKA